jgi:hypothetical protein
MRKILLTLFAGGIIALSLQDCTKSKGPKPIMPEDTIQECDSNLVLYCNKIKPIIDLNCAVTGCHVSGFDKGDFTSYPALKAKADAGLIRQYVLESRIMPPPPRELSDADTTLISQWLAGGAREK